MTSKFADRRARSEAKLRGLSRDTTLHLLIGEGILARVAQLLLRLGAAKHSLHNAIDVPRNRRRTRHSEFTGLSDRVFFDYPAILNEWYTNPEYTDTTGQPAKLRLHGRVRSFDALVHQARPNMDPAEALAVLCRLRAVTRIGRASVAARSRVLSTAASRSLTAARMLSVVDAVLTTVERNLDVGTRRSPVSKFYERAATNHRVDAKYLDEFQGFLLEQGDDFLQTVDDWLTAHSVRNNHSASAARACRVGAGVYMFASD